MRAMQEPSSAVDALRKISFFRDLTDPDLTRLADIGQRHSYEAGPVMVDEDSEPGGLFVILAGAAEVQAGGAVHMLGPGDFFGEMALLARTRRTATVSATEPVEAMEFEPTNFREFLIENPSVSVTLLERVAERLNAAQQRREADQAWW